MIDNTAEIIGIDFPESSQKVNKEPPKERVKFVEYLAKISEQYLRGEIDVVLVGWVDPSGRPYVGVGDYPGELTNDLFVLGASVEKETSKAILELYNAETAG